MIRLIAKVPGAEVYLAILLAIGQDERGEQKEIQRRELDSSQNVPKLHWDVWRCPTAPTSAAPR